MTNCFPFDRRKGILISIIFFQLTSLKVQSQVTLISEGFESGIPSTWSIQSYTANSNQWIPYLYDYNSGSYSAAIFPNVSNTNAWLYSASINMQAGKTYVLSYYAKTNQYTQLRVTLNHNPEYGGIYKTVRSSFPQVSWTQFKDTITCEISGIYYIGFNNYSTNGFEAASLIDDVNFTRMDYTDCNPVTAGTISSSANSVCPGTLFTLTNSNATSAAFGLRYSWQKSADAVNWVNITNSFTYDRTLQISQSTPTYYRLVDTCTVSGNSAISNQVLVNNSSYLTCYCTPSVLNCFNLRFTNVTILNSSINNNTGCITGVGYGNYTSLGAANAYRNQNVYIKTTISTSVNLPHQVGVWIDANQSGTFDETEFVTNIDLTGTTNITQVLIPANAQLGQTRMRLKLKFSSAANTMSYEEACNATLGASGEIEDYLLNIGEPPICSGTVSTGTISGVTQTCPNNNFTITATGTTINQAQMRYAWQKSADNVNWANINNTSYLINPLIVSENSTTYYRLTDTCLATGQSAVSNVLTVTTTNLFSCYCIPANTSCNTFSIDSVSFNTINNPSGCSASGYTNYSTISTTINNGSNVNIFLRFKATSLTKYAQVWIDFNRNGKYDDAEKVFGGSATGINTLSGVVNVPFNISAGETGMRVMLLQGFSADPCNTLGGSGETEDYRVVLNIINPLDAKFCYYVKKTATGLNDGTSWANAFTSLVTAFTYAKIGDTLKVAKGVYTPGTVNTNLFSLKDSMVILGGYPDGGNPTDADRNFSLHQTVMSGEIGTSSNTDNTRIILQASVIKGFLVDGFIIENGYDGYVSTNGPLYFINSTGTLKNSVIRNNYNQSNGNINIQNSTINLLNNFIVNNSGEYSGINATVISITSKSNVTISNCVIAKNKGKRLINQIYSNVTVLNSTFFQNQAFSSIRDTSNLIVQNSIFHHNGIDFNIDTAELQRDVYSTITLTNSITDIYTSSGNIKGSPKFVDTLRVAGADDIYYTNDDGLRLLNPCSPAINTGNNSFVTNLNNDIAGNTRVKNGIVDLGAYEMQEAIIPTPKVLYVNKTATGSNNGQSWQNAFTDLQSAFNNCSDTIKVAKGTYPVSTTDAGAYYLLSNNRVVMGGFPNTGSPTNYDFDPDLNKTIIDGALNGSQKHPTIIVSRDNDSTAKLIGFEIINSKLSQVHPNDHAVIKIGYNSRARFERIKIDCTKNEHVDIVSISGNSSPVFYKSAFYNANPEESPGYGDRSIVISGNSNPLLLKCYFGKDTTSSLSGSKAVGIIITNSRAIIDSCLFFKASNHAIYNVNSSPLIQNTEFRKGFGRSISNNGSNPLVLNCLFRDTVRYQEQYGGTLGNINGSTPVFDNCRFYDSYSSYGGATAYNENSQPLFKNCVFTKTYSTSFGSGFYNKGSQVKFVNCIYSDFIGTASNPTTSGAFVYNYENSTAIIVNSTLVASTLSSGPVISCLSGSSVKLYNSIIWRYGFSGMSLTMPNDIQTTNNNLVTNCDIRNSMLFRQRDGVMSNTTVGFDPKLFDITSISGIDKSLLTADDGLKPCDCSRAINGGDNSLAGIGQDILGQSRIYNGTIDIGAYELQGNPTLANAFYVNQNAPAGGDGLSWSTAFNNLQNAILNNCADTIRIAKGIYKPSMQSRDSSFNVYTPTVMLGGYPDNGTPGEGDRNIHTNPTILSGDIGIPNDSTDNLLSVIKVHCPDSTVILDGLIIEEGNANTGGSAGGGIQSVGNADLRINNCIIRNNYGGRGGGIYTSYSNVYVSKTVITHNNSMSNGGGFYIQDGYSVVNGFPWTPEVRFKNSVISNNGGTGGVVSGSGVGVLVDGISFEDVIFYKNEGYPGAGLRLTDNPYVKISNCHFVKNNVTTYGYAGASIYVQNPYFTLELRTYVNNTIFKGSTVMGGPNQYANNDFNWQNGNVGQEDIPYNNLNASAVDGSQSGTGYEQMVPSGWVFFRDIDNGTGPDNIWMTADDGLQVTNCSASIDRGINSAITLQKDIIDSIRIQNQKVDLGAYETSSFIVKIVATDTAICPGTAVTFTAIGENMGTSPVYQWVLNGVNVGTNSNTYSNSSLSNNDRIQVKIKKAECTINDTAYSNIITMDVGNALTPLATITATDTTICAGKPVVFTATATQSNPTSVYQWMVNNINAGSNSPTFVSSNLVDGDVVKVMVTINGSCLSTQVATSNSILIHVNPELNPTVSIVSSANPACLGSAITYTATPTNGGSTPIYQWKVNGNNAGTNSPVFTSLNIGNNDVVTVVMTSSAGCATSQPVSSNPITQAVGSQTAPSITISSTNITCPGTTITLTASPVNGGTNPLFQWKLNGTNVGLGSNTYVSNALNEGDVIEVVLTSSASCVSTASVSSAPLVVHFSSAVTPTVSIASPTTSICAGSSLSFTATPTHGGTTPSYQWYVNNISAGGNSPIFTTSTLNNSDQVRVIMSSSAGCTLSPTAISNSITVTVSPVGMPTVNITANQSTICTGATVNFTAAPTNGGANPVYQWKRNGNNVGSGGDTYSSNTLSNGDIISCVMTSSSTCVSSPTVTSNNVTITVSAVPTTPTITASGPLSICAGSSVTLTSSATTGNRWYKNGVLIIGATNTTYNATTAGVYTVLSIINSCASAISAATTVIVNAVPAIPTITLAGNQLTTAAGMNGYQWYLNNAIISGATSDTYTPTASGLYKVEVTNAAGCKAISTEYNFTITAVGDVTINGVEITCFPSPTSRLLNIKLSAIPVHKPVAQLMDYTGRVVSEFVLNSQLQTIDVSHLASGVYILNIVGKKAKAIIKVEVIR